MMLSEAMKLIGRFESKQKHMRNRREAMAEQEALCDSHCKTSHNLVVWEVMKRKCRLRKNYVEQYEEDIETTLSAFKSEFKEFWMTDYRNMDAANWGKKKLAMRRTCLRLQGDSFLNKIDPVLLEILSSEALWNATDWTSWLINDFVQHSLPSWQTPNSVPLLSELQMKRYEKLVTLLCSRSSTSESRPSQGVPGVFPVTLLVDSSNSAFSSQQGDVVFFQRMHVVQNTKF
jgi:hypothetical protein